MIERLHQVTYNGLRRRCRKYFSDLVPGKHVDLIMVSEKLEDGFKFILRKNNAELINGLEEDADRSINELSGGQKSLLGLSFIFACALSRPSPLYLMDEIDAALDEANQQAVSRIISHIFKEKTIFCVSHHPDFQMHASHKIQANMLEGSSIFKIEHSQQT